MQTSDSLQHHYPTLESAQPPIAAGIPFPDATFDLVFGIQTFEHWGQRVNAVVPPSKYVAEEGDELPEGANRGDSEKRICLDGYVQSAQAKRLIKSAAWLIRPAARVDAGVPYAH